jgi:hypothetical protein
MRRLLPLIVPALLAAMPFASAADQTYLQADFDDKTIDAPVGTGGAAVGEPVVVDPYVTAIVRSSPPATPNLEIQDNDTYMAGSVRFEFLGGVEVTSGLVVIRVNVRIPEFVEGGAVSISVREQGSAAQDFTDLIFFPDGAVTCSDAAGPLGGIGSYQEGLTFPVTIAHDLGAGTYGVWLDGTQVVVARAHGITGHGIGGVYFGCMHDTDLAGRLIIDDIVVTDYLPTPIAPTT